MWAFFIDIINAKLFLRFFDVIFFIPDDYCSAFISTFIIIIILPFFKSCKSFPSLTARFLNSYFGVWIFISCSSKLLIYSFVCGAMDCHFSNLVSILTLACEKVTMVRLPDDGVFWKYGFRLPVGQLSH